MYLFSSFTLRQIKPYIALHCSANKRRLTNFGPSCCQLQRHLKCVWLVQRCHYSLYYSFIYQSEVTTRARGRPARSRRGRQVRDTQNHSHSRSVAREMAARILLRTIPIVNALFSHSARTHARTHSTCPYVRA